MEARTHLNYSGNSGRNNKTSSFSRVEHSINSVISEEAPTVKRPRRKSREVGEEEMRRQEGLKKIVLVGALVVALLLALESLI